jgi:hypothetical protein
MKCCSCIKADAVSYMKIENVFYVACQACILYMVQRINTFRQGGEEDS